MKLITAKLALALFVGISAATSALAATIDTGLGNATIGNFGFPDSQTYGEVFTAAISGNLSDFTLSLNGGVSGAIYGGVGVWNGTSAYSGGGGVSSVLFQSGNVPSNSGGSFTFLPNISVTAGQLYVAYISVFGTGATGLTTMPRISGGAADPNANYFVWNNGNGGPSSSSWNYFSNFGDAQFTANISPSTVPVPAALPLLATGIIGLGAAARRRNKRKAV
jgi:hypothetical protein